MTEERCLLCGEIIPEGMQVCPRCQKKWYKCDPYKNKKCRGTECFVTGGDCYITEHREFAKDENV